MEYTLVDMSDTTTLAHEALRRAKAKHSEGALVLALYGDLGTGKTTFVQVLASLLNVEDTVISPTFVIMKKYQTDDDVFNALVHIDAYRLLDEKSSRTLGFANECARSNTLVAVEWPEGLGDEITGSAIKIHFRHATDSHGRQIRRVLIEEV